MDDTHRRMPKRALCLLLGAACATPAVLPPAAAPTASGPSATLVVEVRRLSDSVLVGGRRAQLQRARDTVFAEPPGPPREAGPVVFPRVEPGRYVLWTVAIGYRPHVDTINVPSGTGDTVRTYLDIYRCDLACPGTEPPRRPWWKFWQRAPTI